MRNVEDLTSEAKKNSGLSIAKGRITDIAIAINRAQHALMDYLNRIANIDDGRKTVKRGQNYLRERSDLLVKKPPRVM